MKKLSKEKRSKKEKFKEKRNERSRGFKRKWQILKICKKNLICKQEFLKKENQRKY